MDITLDEARKLLLPSLCLSAVTYVVFLIAGYGSLSVLCTIVLSSLYAILNFVLLGASLTVALSKSFGKAQFYMASQYLVRFIITGSVLYYSLTLPFINPLAVIIPMLFPRVILVSKSFEIFKKRRGK